jgi:hypothetical protein
MKKIKRNRSHDIKNVQETKKTIKDNGISIEIGNNAKFLNLKIDKK